MLFKSDSDIFVVSAGFIGFIGKQNIKFHHLRDATGPVIRLPLDNKFVALWPNHATAFSVETGAPSASTKIWVPLTNMVCQRLPNKDLALPQKSWREFADAVYDRNGYFDRLFLDTTVNEMKRLQGTGGTLASPDADIGDNPASRHKVSSARQKGRNRLGGCFHDQRRSLLPQEK